MLRKSFPLLLKPIFRSSALNLVKCTRNTLSTSSSYWNKETSVLVDPGIIKPSTPDKFQLQSVLTLPQVEKFDEIQKLRSSQDVIKFLRNNKKLIVPLQAPLFEKIFEIMQSRSDTTAEMLVSNTEFEDFCKSVNKSARALRPSDVLIILKTLKALKISTNSTLSQSLLHVLSKSINELNIGQMIFIEFIIRGAPSSPITEALQIALPIVFNANVRSKLNYGNPKSMTEALCFALSAHAPFKIIDLIVEALLDVRDQLTFDQCKDIVMGFLFNKVKKMAGPRAHLYSFCMTNIKNGIEENMNFKEIRQLTHYIVNSFLFADSFYYDEVVLDKVAKYVIANKLPLFDAGVIMKTFGRISYVDLDLVNYVDRLLSETADLEKMPDGVLSTLALIFACADARYLPPNWSTYESKFIDYFLNKEDVDIPLVRIALDLASLDRWHFPLIEKVFAEDFLRQYLQRKHNRVDYLNVLNLYQAVATLKKDQVKVLPPDDIIETAIKHQIEVKDQDFSPSLEVLFGGKSYIVNRVLSKYGHFIDHLLVTNKNGEPLPIRDEGVQDGQQLENIVLPTNGYAFAVISMSPTCYCIDGVKLRGRFKLYIDMLTTQGVIPVPLSVTVWESLQDSEKLPYLQREIFSRIPGNDSYQSSEQMS